MRKFNEGKVCDAVVRFLEEREQGNRAKMSLPDQDGDIDPVEVAFQLNGLLYALEHTGIEPFDRQIAHSQMTGKFLDPIRLALEGIVPAGECYALAVPPDAADGLRPREVEPLQQKVITWVAETAPQRTLLASNRVDTEHGTVEVPGIPFPVILTRRHRLSATSKAFELSYVRADDEPARLLRIQKGYDKKIPKLMAWKDKSGARTVLVFESNDLQLTNHVVVTEAVLEIVETASRRPDEIFLVDTSHREWHVIPLLIDDVSVFELDAGWHWDIDPGRLDNLTGR